MTKGLLPALLPVALLAACTEEVTDDDARAATGKVLEGTISDAMLPIDRVQSEPPLEDPEAFAEAQEKAGDAPGEAAESAEAEAAGEESGEAEEAPATEPSLEVED